MSVSLITGCSSGIGYATALRFARKGWKTFATSRNLDRPGIAELQRVRDQENLPLELLELDITKEDSVQAAVETVIREARQIDVLVNNAGFGVKGAIESISIEDARRQFETNVFGTLRMCQAVLPQMRLQGKGRIVTVGSISGRISFPIQGVYAASKHAIAAMMEALRYESADFGIKVSLIEPGGFRTSFMRNMTVAASAPDQQRRVATYMKALSFFFDENPGSLKGQLTNPDRVARLIVKVSAARSPKMRYLIGVDARAWTILRGLLPSRLWHWIMAKL